MPQHLQYYAGYCLALIATFAWGFNFVIARLVSNDISPFALAFGRWCVAGLFFLIIALPPVIRQRQLLLKHWKLLSLSSITGVLLFNSTIYIGAQTSEAASLSIIAATSPIFTALISQKQKNFGWLQWMGIFLASLGIMIIIGQGNPFLWESSSLKKGDLWMFLGAFIWSVYTILLQRKPAEISMTAFHAVCVWLALPWLFLLAIWEIENHQPIIWSSTVISSVLYVGIVASVLCYYCWNGAIIRIGAVRTGTVGYMLPLAAALEGLIFLSEPLFAYHYVTMVFVIVGVYLSSRRRIKQ